MKIRVIGVPSAWGTKELGARRTPDRLREAGFVRWLAAPGIQVEDVGDVDVTPQGDDDRWSPAKEGDDLVHLSQVVQTVRGVRRAVSEALDEAALPIVVGGECSICIGAVPALSARGGPPAVAWFDAHGDMNTPETSPSGLLTGMPFAAMLGHGHPDLLAVGKNTERPPGTRTFLLGGRDLDPAETDNVRAFGVRHLDTTKVRSMGPEEVAMEILDVPEIAVAPPEARRQILAENPLLAHSYADLPQDPVYLHFDVDSIDPEQAPGVHYRVPGGFDASEVGQLAGYLCASGRVGAIGVASANLDHDVEGRTVAAIRDVVVSMADALSHGAA